MARETVEIGYIFKFWNAFTTQSIIPCILHHTSLDTHFELNSISMRLLHFYTISPLFRLSLSLPGRSFCFTVPIPQLISSSHWHVRWQNQSPPCYPCPRVWPPGCAPSPCSWGVGRLPNCHLPHINDHRGRGGNSRAGRNERIPGAQFQGEFGKMGEAGAFFAILHGATSKWTKLANNKKEIVCTRSNIESIVDCTLQFRLSIAGAKSFLSRKLYCFIYSKFCLCLCMLK